MRGIWIVVCAPNTNEGSTSAATANANWGPTFAFRVDKTEHSTLPLCGGIQTGLPALRATSAT